MLTSPSFSRFPSHVLLLLQKASRVPSYTTGKGKQARRHQREGIVQAAERRGQRRLSRRSWGLCALNVTLLSVFSYLTVGRSWDAPTPGLAVTVSPARMSSPSCQHSPQPPLLQARPLSCLGHPIRTRVPPRLFLVPNPLYFPSVS